MTRLFIDITNGGRSLFLAYNNPNYTAQILAFSVIAPVVAGGIGWTYWKKNEQLR